MIAAILGIKKYYKCSYCKILDSMNPLNKMPICQRCHQPLKEISEMEYKQKVEMSRKYKEERRKYNEENNNRKDSQRNNSSLHSSRIQFNNNDERNNNNININMNNNINNNNQNNHHYHRGIQIKIINSGNGHQNIIRIGGGRDHSSDRNQNSHRNHNMIILNNISNNNNHNTNRNNNMNVININNNINSNQNINLIHQGQRNPFRVVVQRHHVSNDIFDPNFNLFGSTFNHIFQDNFSSNFRSNFRGNFINEILGLLERNRAEVNRNKNNPISEQNMQKLKKFKLTEKYCKKENGNIEKPNCCICLEEIELGKDTLLLPCGHMFHAECCLTWLKKSNTCPICRFEIK